MNPAMLIIIILGCVALWFLLSSLYKPLGKLFYKIGKDAMDEMKEEEETKEVEDERK